MVGINLQPFQVVTLGLPAKSPTRRGAAKLVVDSRVPGRVAQRARKGAARFVKQFQVIIGHAQLEVDIHGIRFDGSGLLKVFSRQRHLLDEHLFILVFERLPVLAVGAAKIILHFICWRSVYLRQLELVHGLRVLLVVEKL